MRYGTAFTLTAGAVGVYGTEQVFRLNSIYDPDLTSTGHQPYGHDTMATLYNRYRVNRVRICLKISDPSADGVNFCAWVQDATNAYAVTGNTPDTMIEKPGVMFRDINNTGAQVVNYQQEFAIPHIMGITRQQFEADTLNYSAATGANPTLTPYIRMAICALDGSSTPTVRVQACLMYYVSFWERVTLGQS